VVWVLPDVLTRPGAVTGKDLLEARNSVRVSLLQACGGGLIALGLFFTAKTLRLNREGQLTDRYSKAIEQMGHESVDVRLGGIYALERLSRDSPSDYPTIVEVLCAFVREHTSQPGIHGRDASDDPVSADVDAAVRVLARRTDTGKHLDLSHCGLNKLSLGPGNWDGTNFVYSAFDGGTMTGSSLEGATFAFTRIRQSGFNHIKGAGVNFVRAHVQAWFVDADLTRADFRYCDLTHSDFSGRYDEGAPRRLRSPAARLAGARFDGAILKDVNFSGVDLSEVVGMTRSQLTDAIVDAATIEPKTFIVEGEQELSP
jgi:uncharacterized protein YjbI with pentapeptide repeats